VTANSPRRKMRFKPTQRGVPWQPVREEPLGIERVGVLLGSLGGFRAWRRFRGSAALGGLTRNQDRVSRSDWASTGFAHENFVRRPFISSHLDQPATQERRACLVQLAVAIGPDTAAGAIAQTVWAFIGQDMHGRRQQRHWPHMRHRTGSPLTCFSDGTWTGPSARSIAEHFPQRIAASEMAKFRQSVH